MNMQADAPSHHNRFLNLVPALLESTRISRLHGTAGNIIQVLRAARVDPRVLKETRRIMGELPDGAVEKLMGLYRTRDPSDRRVKSKYYNLPVHVAHAVWQAKQLGLYDAGRSLRIVDLGTGFGYFPLVCDAIGHVSTGLDWDRWKVYESIRKDIVIDRREWVITPDEPMPEMEAAVDVVTAFRPVFYYEFEQDSLWNDQKWNRFFGMVKKQLAEDAFVFIGENRISEGQKPHYRNMVVYFEGLGARAHQHGWLFRASQLPTLTEA